ncbi:MAG: phosphatase PAP2 family protein [Actinomycetota bacterium]|nr:phosphatase PAP2 family protein [Actinomycetota bacterium]
MNPDDQKISGFLAATWLLAPFGALTVFVVSGWTRSLDDAWNTAMSAGEAAWLVNVAMVFHHGGTFPIALATVVIVTIGFLALRQWWIAGAWVAMVAVSQLLSKFTKALVGRERPLDGLVQESSAAYPSGHTMVSGVAIAVGLAVLLGILWPNRHRLFLSIGIWYAVLMALSRTYLRAHWLTDVVGGLLFGAVVVLVVAAMAARRSSLSRPSSLL